MYELNGFGIAVEINGAVAFVGRPRSRLLATLFVWDGKQAHVVCARACKVRREQGKNTKLVFKLRTHKVVSYSTPLLRRRAGVIYTIGECAISSNHEVGIYVFNDDRERNCFSSFTPLPNGVIEHWRVQRIHAKA